MKSTRKENKFLKLIDLFQNLIDEENRQRAESATINLARQRAENKSKRENSKDEEDKKNDSNEENDKKNKCSRYDRSSHSKEKCSIVNSECIECHKTDH
jgi:hypothetical protein